ncbi:MAG: agmatine deiminase family protein [Acidobacteriota bacterium]
MPAEWEPHQATWLAWPHEKSDWPGKFAPIPWIYAQIVRHLARVEKVRILIQDADAERAARRHLKLSQVNLDAVEFFHHKTNRSWTRDYCPIFVKSRQVKSRQGQVAITQWRFNGWAKYDNWQNDASATAMIANKLGLQRFEAGLVLEGGSIDVNGAGKLLTTEECLLDEVVQTRNPGLGRRGYEKAFRQYLGVSEVIWLHRGIAGDDTHGHVDDLARFTDANTVVTVLEHDKGDANYDLLRENLARLKAHRDLRIVTLPMPEPVVFDGQRLPASYANFYIANKLVLVPLFTDKNDVAALKIIAKLFPDREIVGIPCRDLVLGLGTLHCMTQQQPA